MSFMHILSLRYQFEETVSYRKSFKLPNYNSTITDLKWFVENGRGRNGGRAKYPQALELATEILELCGES